MALLGLVKMKKRDLIILSLFLLFILSVPTLANKAEGTMYVVNLNYKKTPSGEFLNLINSYITQGQAVNYREPTTGYRLDILSDSSLLKSTRFSVPFGAVMLKGMTRDNAQGTPDDLNFTIYVSYYEESKRIDIYDKFNNKVLEILVKQFNNLGESASLEGKLEVIHSDDFENPQNSRYFFYLNTGSGRYELESAEQLPVVRSGVPVLATGKITGNKIILESLSLKPEEKKLGQVKSSEKYFNFEWAYIILPLALIFGLLVFVEVKRQKDHQNLLEKKNLHDSVALKQYVNSSLSKGFSKDNIRNALLKNSYKQKEIEDAFK